MQKSTNSDAERVREWKALPAHVKSVAGRTVVGLFAICGNRDETGDVIWPGAFAKSLQERNGKFLHLWQHDMDDPPIALIEDIREVGRGDLPPAVLSVAPEATGGLQCTRTYLDTLRGNEVLANLAAGVPLQGSFAFDVIKCDFTRADGTAVPMASPYAALFDDTLTRNLRELRLYETSDVNWGANDATVASKRRGGLGSLVAQLELFAGLKEGRRTNKDDQATIDQLHDLIALLEPTTCPSSPTYAPGEGDPDPDGDDDAKSRAALWALTQRQRSRLVEIGLALPAYARR